MKVKRALWIAVMVPGTVIFVAYSLFMAVFQVIPASLAVFELAMFRFECWSADVGPGEMVNCPFTTRTYIQEFIDVYQGNKR